MSRWTLLKSVNLLQEVIQLMHLHLLLIQVLLQCLLDDEGEGYSLKLKVKNPFPSG
jgi:hypothetical protein